MAGHRPLNLSVMLALNLGLLSFNMIPEIEILFMAPYEEWSHSAIVAAPYLIGVILVGYVSAIGAWASNRKASFILLICVAILCSLRITESILTFSDVAKLGYFPAGIPWPYVVTVLLWLVWPFSNYWYHLHNHRENMRDRGYPTQHFD